MCSSDLEELKYVGTLCVEFFIDRNDNLYVNEIAPRVHNSGHLTINAFNISQFGIHADAALTANQLYKEIKKQKIVLNVKNWTNYYLKERSKFLNDRDNTKTKNFPIQPSSLFKELRKVLPKNSAITLDAGTLCLQATDSLNYYSPLSLFTPLDFGLVGFSFACGI